MHTTAAFSRRALAAIFAVLLTACGGGGGGDGDVEERVIGGLLFGQFVRGNALTDIEIRMEVGPENSRISLVTINFPQERLLGPRLEVGAGNVLVDEAARDFTNGSDDLVRFFGRGVFDGGLLWNQELAQSSASRESHRLVQLVPGTGVDLQGLDVTALQTEIVLERIPGINPQAVWIWGFVRILGRPASGDWGPLPDELPLAVAVTNFQLLDDDATRPVPLRLQNALAGFTSVPLATVDTDTVGLQPRVDVSSEPTLPTVLARATDGLSDEIPWPFGLELPSIAEVVADDDGNDLPSPLPPFYLVPRTGPDLVGYTITGAQFHAERIAVDEYLEGEIDLGIRGAVVIYGRPE